jgi:hypothetical protein
MGARAMSAAEILPKAIRQLELLFDENRDLRGENMALRAENHALSEEQHLRDTVDAALLLIPEKRSETARAMIGRTTLRLANQHRPAREIKSAVLAEAARIDYPSKAAIRLAGAILDEWAADHG